LRSWFGCLTSIRACQLADGVKGFNERVVGVLPQGEFWTRYGDGDCIRRKAPLCPFQGIGSKVLAPTPEHVRRQLTMPKLHPSHADIFTLMHSHAGSQLLLIAAGALRMMALDPLWT
jgi:hypothetical protein